MKITKKLVNSALPKITEIERSYTPSGYTGFSPYDMRRLREAIAEINDDETISIYLYGVGDAYEERHYYNKYRGSVITDIIENWLRGEATRDMTVTSIVE